MSRAREEIQRMIQKEFLKPTKSKHGFEINLFSHLVAGITDSDNFVLYKKFITEEYGVSYDRFELNPNELSEYRTFSKCDKFGYSISTINMDLKYLKHDNIWIPDKISPGYIQLEDGYYYFQSPIDYEGSDTKENLFLKKTQKTMSSFW